MLKNQSLLLEIHLKIPTQEHLLECINSGARKNFNSL